MTSDRPVGINGHRLTRTGITLNMGSAGMQWEWKCGGCQARATVDSFTVGNP